MDSSDTSIALARNLSLPLVSRVEWMAGRQNDFALMLIPYYYGNAEEHATFALAIDSLPPATIKTKNRSKQTGWKKQNVTNNAFFVELCPPQASRAGRRATGASRSNDLLLKAIMPWKGLAMQSNKTGAVVLDMTAGFGQDSLLLAMSGAERVHMVERNPIVAALLFDALRRLNVIAESRIASSATPEYKKRHELANFLRSKLSLSSQDAREWLLQNEQVSLCRDQHRNILVYLDPMFPPRRKSAAVKKGMSVLHDLLETQSINTVARLKDEAELLLLALRFADLRVVVKRPINASPLGVNIVSADHRDGEHNQGDRTDKDGTLAKPSYSIVGSTNRWDIYVKQ
jgi:16S rRNA G966 N2-methylase RsmD